MSVTFFIPDAPTEVVYPYPDEPEYRETRPVAPFIELNMANSNAADVLEKIAPWADPYCGTWGEGELRRVQRATMLVLNRDPASLVKAPVQDGNFYECGRDMDYVTRRLTQMLTLVTVALQHGLSVSYG